MRRIIRVIETFLIEETAATAVEYAMIVGLIALVSFLAFRHLGYQVKRIIYEMYIKMKVHIRG